MEGSVSKLGGEENLSLYRSIAITAGSFLLVTGVALVVLSAMGYMGELQGVGAISGLTLGSADLLVIFAISLAFALNSNAKNVKANEIATNTCSQEQLKHVYWYCLHDSDRKKLAGLYDDTNGLDCDRWKKFNPNESDKVVVMITFTGKLSTKSFSEEGSPPYDIVTQFHETLGDRLLLLLDVTDQTRTPKDTIREMLSEDAIWDTICGKGRAIWTQQSDWQERLTQFIAK